MSRTVRRLPLTGSHGKWYATVSYPTLFKPRRAPYRISPGVLLCPKHGWKQESLLRYMDHLEPDLRFGGWRVVTSFLHCETEEDVLADLAHTYMYWCRKNKTCRRQRKNGVKKTKRIIARQKRAQFKQALHRECKEPN